MSAVLWIAALWVAFAGTHMLLSSAALRPQLVGRLGEKAYLGLYTLVALLTFVPLAWVYFTNRHAGGVVWDIAAMGGARPLAILFAASGIALAVAAMFQPSPAVVGGFGGTRARGLTRVTRHPLFTGIALWSAGHLLVNGFAADVVFFGGMLAFSMLGAAHQDARKRAGENGGLEAFFEETSFTPFAAIVSGRNRLVWSELPWAGLAIGIAVAVAILLLHPWMFR